MRLTISNCRSGTDSTFTLKPFSSRYLAYSSQHPHCRGLYMVAVFASSAAAGETAKSAPKVAVRTNAAFIVGFLVIRSEEHTSELQSLMRISYAVFCLKKKKT